MILRVEKEIGTPGEGQEFLREVIASLNKGFRKGDDWTIEPGEITHATKEVKVETSQQQQIEGLDVLALHLRELVTNPVSTDAEFEFAKINLLPVLSDVLSDAGYGRMPEIPEGDKPFPETKDTTSDEAAPWEKKK